MAEERSVTCMQITEQIELHLSKRGTKPSDLDPERCYLIPVSHLEIDCFEERN